LTAPCTTIDWVGVTAPSGYLLLNGQLVSRTTFAALFGCISVQGVAATTSNGSASVVVPNSALFQIGWFVSGNNVTCNSTVSTIPDGTHITISSTAGASGATTLTIGPYSQGDCSTTFAVGNFQGRATAMRDVAGSTLTATTCANPASQGSPCGTQIQTLVTNNLPPYTPTVSSSTTVLNGGAGGDIVVHPTGGAVNVGGTGSGGTFVPPAPVTTVIMNAQGGTSTPFSNLQPTALVDKYIKF